MPDQLKLNRFYRIDGTVCQYLGPIQGLHVFENEHGEYASFTRIPADAVDCEDLEVPGA